MENGKSSERDPVSTVARQWALLQALPRSPAKIGTAALEARLQGQGHHVSRRTIERDLHALSTHFPLLLDDRSRPYGWSWARDSRMEVLPRLDTSQAIALLLAREHLRNLLPGSMHRELLPAFDLAARVLAGTGWQEWHQRTAVLPTGLALQPPRIPDGVLDRVQQAIAHRRCMSAQYRSKGSAHPRQMHIHPLGLLSRGPVMYLVCTLFDYDDVRQLALHRLSDPIGMPEQARCPEGFDFQRYIREIAPAYLSRGLIRLVARIDAPAAEHLSETPLSDDQTLQPLSDGRVEVAATVQDDESLRWWLLAFGSQLEVVEPADLRAWAKDETSLSSSRYEASNESNHDNRGNNEQQNY